MQIDDFSIGLKMLNEYNSQSLYLNNIIMTEQEVETTTNEVLDDYYQVHVTVSTTGIALRTTNISFSFLTNHPNYEEIKSIALESLNAGYISKTNLVMLNEWRQLLWLDDELKVTHTNSIYNGETLPHNLHKILASIDFEDELEVNAWKTFLYKLSYVPYFDVYQSIGDYILENNVRINTDGDLLLNKVVRQDLTDTYSGTISFEPGTNVKIPRFNLNPNPESLDPFGIHVYPVNSYPNGSRIINVVVPVVGIIRVPKEHNKLTVYRLSVI